MKVAITGSSGLIGTALAASLRARGDSVLRVLRSPSPPADATTWDPATGAIDPSAFVGVDAVVHLAGVGIGDRRWNDAHKAAVLDSRVDGTTLLSQTLADIDGGPSVLLSGSAIGFYGDTGDTPVDESSPRGTGFLADVCAAWEASTAAAEAAGIRVAHLRTGVVQSTNGGALKKLLLPFKLGVGGKIGSGRQFMSWITIQDQVSAIEYLLDNEISGPVNLTAPTPVTNAEYTKALGAAVKRPTIFPVPPFVLKLILGSEGAENLALISQRVVPQVLTEAGFAFAHPDVEPAMAAVVKGKN